MYVYVSVCELLHVKYRMYCIEDSSSSEFNLLFKYPNQLYSILWCYTHTYYYYYYTFASHERSSVGCSQSWCYLVYFMSESRRMTRITDCYTASRRVGSNRKQNKKLAHPLTCDEFAVAVVVTVCQPSVTTSNLLVNTEWDKFLIDSIHTHYSY